LSARGDSLVGGGKDVVGKVDQSAPGWFRQRDQLVGRKFAACGPGDAFVAGLALLDCDLGLPLRDLIPMMRAGAVRPGWSAAVSRTT
jgi:hypothetical protein